MVQAEVVKTGAETAMAVIRKFSRKVQGTGIVKLARKRRYYARPASKVMKKKSALKRIKKGKEYVRLVKEGKVAEPVRRSAPREREQGGTSRFGETTPIAR